MVTPGRHPPAGGTSTSGAATPASALTGATSSVSDGSWTRGRSRRVSRGRGQRRRLSAGRSVVECRGQSGCLRHHGELLEEKLVPHDMEGGKGHDPLDERLQVAIAGAKATQKVQHQGTVGHRLAEVAEGVCHALHLAAVLPHGDVPMKELVELGVEVEGPSVLVPEELFLKGEPHLLARVRLVAKDVL